MREDSKTSMIFITSDKENNEGWFRELSKFIQIQEYVGIYSQDKAKPPKFDELIKTLYKSLKNTVIVKSSTENKNIE